MAYIYKIVNDINEKTYVGKTEFSVKKRFQEHCLDSKKERCKDRPLYRAMNKYGVQHFHVFEIEQTNNPEEREKYWIEKLGTYKIGYNATIGGDGKKYINHDLVVETYSQLHNANAVSKILNISADSVINILRENKIIPYTTQEVNKAHGKPIGQFLDGVLINIYPNLHEAGKRLQKDCTHISACANGKRKTAYGYNWKFLS